MIISSKAFLVFSVCFEIAVSLGSCITNQEAHRRNIERQLGHENAACLLHPRFLLHEHTPNEEHLYLKTPPACMGARSRKPTMGRDRSRIAAAAQHAPGTRHRSPVQSGAKIQNKGLSQERRESYLSLRVIPSDFDRAQGVVCGVNNLCRNHGKVHGKM